MIVFYAAYLSLHKDKLREFRRGFVKPLVFLIPPIAILVGIQNHLSASILIIGVTGVMMLMAGSKLSHFLTAGIAAARSRAWDFIYISYTF